MLLIQFDPISQSNTISTDPGMIPLVNQNKTGFTYSLFINDTCNLYLSSDDKNDTILTYGIIPSQIALHHKLTQFQYNSKSRATQSRRRIRAAAYKIPIKETNCS